MPRLKVCCIAADDVIREVAAWARGRVRGFLLTSRTDAEAIAAVRPHGLDVCSGVRRDGKLDAVRLAALSAVLADALRA